MPTLYPPQLIEIATPMLEVFERMRKGLAPSAHRILETLGYYAERDLRIPESESELTSDEQ